MAEKQLIIEGFAPNCLMGVTGAIVKYKGYTENINRLYFHASYLYERKEGKIYYPEKNTMNVEFSRELPMTKEVFQERLRGYYGLEYFYHEYSDFEEMVSVLEEYTRLGEPIMVEIDFFFMKKYRHYGNVHSQHMMIVEKIDREKKVFHVCEAVFGHFEMPFEEYFSYFQDVIQNRRRNVFLLKVSKKSQVKHAKIHPEWFLKDLEKTQMNFMEATNAVKGMRALINFKADFMSLFEEGILQDDLVVPGMWVFMCDNMNNVNFIQEWKLDYPDFISSAMENIRKSSIIINRKWFYISMALKDLKKYTSKDFEKAFAAIEKADGDLVDNIEPLKVDIMNYFS